MDIDFAAKAKENALECVRILNDIIKINTDWSTEEMKEFKKSIGLTIGKIEMDILLKIYENHKDLDDIY
ncbi:hypothetical protein [Agrobacterium burrii]